MSKVQSIENKIKFEAFGKTKRKKRIQPKEEVTENEIGGEGPRKLSMKQVENMETAISKVSSGNKGRCGKYLK